MRELDTRRIKQLNNLNYASGGVVYWMQRDRRCNDNWALVHAQNLAIKFKAPLTIFYSLNGNFSNANVRQYGFMLEGLVDTIEDLKKHEYLPAARIREAEEIIALEKSFKSNRLNSNKRGLERIKKCRAYIKRKSAKQ